MTSHASPTPHRPWTRPSRRAVAGVCGGLLAVLAAGACGDASSDPLSAVATVETVPTLALTQPLPSVEELSLRLPDPGLVRGELAAWSASWSDDDGEVTRIGARGRLVPLLHGTLGDGAARSVLSSLAWLRADQEFLDGFPQVLAQPLGEALVLADMGERALAEGEGEEALGWALAATDRVRAVTTPAVARRMVARGETLLAAAEAAGPVGDRAEHLMNGARRALAEEDWALAVQRAFYACQVLEGAGDPGAS